MKHLFKKFLSLLAIIGVISLTTNFLSPDPVSAVPIESNCSSFLGLTPWNCGIEDINNQGDLKNGIWQIAANIATDITVIAAYLVIAYIIYGGYQYIFSGGDAGKVANGKKTLNQAFIGLAIVLSANVIMSAIRIALLGGSGVFADCATTDCVTPGSLVIDVFNWFIGIAGVVSVIFVVYGGLLYITSAGDSGKLTRAKDVIKYALIGLAIVALSFAISAFMSNVINDANGSNASQENNPN